MLGRGVVIDGSGKFNRIHSGNCGRSARLPEIHQILRAQGVGSRGYGKCLILRRSCACLAVDREARAYFAVVSAQAALPIEAVKPT